MKKCIWTLLAILLITSLALVACGGEEPAVEEPAVEEPEEPAEEEEAPAEEAETAILQVYSSWLAHEGDVFEAVLDGFTESSGIEYVHQGSDEVLAQVITRVSMGDPPDLAVLPVAQGLRDLVAQGAVIPLDPFADEVAANFSAGWIDQFTIDGHLYAIPTRSNIQSCLWFNPEVVGDPPTSWSEFTAYCDSVVAEGNSCTAGLANTPWTLDILFMDTHLSTFGLEKYNALMAREIPFNDPSVVEAFNRITTFYSDDYAAGGTAGALGTGLVDGIARVFGTDPDARFCAAGSWAGGVAISAVNEDLIEGETIDFIPFPGETAGEGTIIASADVLIMLVDSPEARQLVSFLISPEGQALFAPYGYTVANKNVDPGLFVGLQAKAAQLLAEYDVGPDYNAPWSNELRSKFNEAIGAALLDPDNIQSILDDLEANIDG